ncbi:MAG: hypothetical protein ABF242_05770 [Flavobacteriales bacterium]
MITSLFKNNILSYFLVSALAVLLWGIAFFQISLDVPVSINFANQEFLFSRKIALFFSFSVTLFGAFFLNYKLKKYLFSYQPTNLFAFFYILISGLGISSPFIIVFSLVALGLVFVSNYLFYFIENKESESQVFNAAFILGFLIFHNIAFVVLIPLLLLNLGAVRRITDKEIILIMTGFLLPSILLTLLSILTENLEILNAMLHIDFSFPKIPWKSAALHLIILLISAAGYRLVVTKRSGIDINIFRLTKNMFVFLIAIFVLVIVSLFLFSISYVGFVISIPVSIFLAAYFTNSTVKYKEILFLILVVAIILNSFAK